MLQRATRYFVSFALCLFLSLITAPSPTTVVLGLDLGRLAGAAIAFSIGAALGRASRGKFWQIIQKYYNRYKNLLLIWTVVLMTIKYKFFRKRKRQRPKLWSSSIWEERSRTST